MTENWRKLLTPEKSLNMTNTSINKDTNNQNISKNIEE
jgi:hypothetical protein